MKQRKFDLGKMRHRLAIYPVTRVSDGGGGFVRQDPASVAPLTTSWAYLAPVSANEREWGVQFTEVTTHKCWLRYDSRVMPGMIVRHRTTDYYVEAIYDPDNLKEFIILALREGGPL